MKTFFKRIKIEAIRLASEQGNTQAVIERDLGEFLSNLSIDAPRINGKNFHGRASTLWLSHENGHRRFVR